jgi:hypothetical protein
MSIVFFLKLAKDKAKFRAVRVFPSLLLVDVMSKVLLSEDSLFASKIFVRIERNASVMFSYFGFPTISADSRWSILGMVPIKGAFVSLLICYLFRMLESNKDSIYT